MDKAFRTFNWLIPFMILIAVTLACSTSTQTIAPTHISTRTSPPTVITTVPPNTTPTNIKPTIPTSTSKPTATKIPPTPTPIPSLYLGDTFQNDGYALTALAVYDPATPSQFYSLETGAKVIAVDFVVSNVSGDMISVEAGDVILLDTEGYAYPYDIWSIDDYLETTDLFAGEQVRGLVGFKVPETATPSRIKISKESIFSASYQLQTSLLPPPEGYAPVALSFTPIIPASKMGDVVEQDGYSITATNIEDPANQNVSSEPPQGFKWVAVEIILSNVSATNALSVYAGSTYLVDTNGYIYQADEYYGRDGQIQSVDLNVGERSKGWVSYILPENATPLYVKYQIDIYNDTYIITGLSK